MLAVLLGCVALLIAAPSTLAAEGAYQISGTVTQYTLSEDIIPLQNVEVTVYEVGGSELPVGSAVTEAKGKYTVERLTEGSYLVEFSPVFESGLNYVPQFYENASTSVTAKTVVLHDGESVGDLNAELRVGGKIEGTVTDALTHAVLPKIEVAAYGVGEISDGFASTNASGQYTISGLATGSYTVGFTSWRYITQYFNNQPSLAGSNSVAVVQESTTTGINAALVLRAPVDAAAPVTSGTPAVGHTLSCWSGSWTGSPTLAYTYAWLRSGSAIVGANASTYGVQAADQGRGLACRVTATNKSGSAHAVSNTLTVPSAPAISPKSPMPRVLPLASRIAVSRSWAQVPVLCENASCVGTIELTERIALRRHRGRRTISRRETLVLGKGAYGLVAGRSATIDIHLTATGRHVLARARHHRLHAGMYVSVVGGTTVRETVVLSEIVPPEHRRRQR